jgi:hypothetical protein
MSELNKSPFAGESLGLKGRFFVEDLTDNDQIRDLQKYLSKFGTLKACNINKGRNRYELFLISRTVESTLLYWI